MPLYEPGRYVCVGGHGFVPTVIKIATRSRFCHVVMLENETGDIIEAMPGGVRRAHISQYAGLPAVCNLAEPMTSTQQAKIIAAAQSAIGTPYDYLDIADDGLESLGVFWSWLANLANGDHEVDCSEAMAMWGAAAGFDWSCGKKDLSEVTPANLARRPWTVPIEIKAA
ncbi:MAG TPA: hypothetical protein VN088_19115 [Nocardioides sp.]|nr:hypothetical protein [Nocardioides sp.]